MPRSRGASRSWACSPVPGARLCEPQHFRISIVSLLFDRLLTGAAAAGRRPALQIPTGFHTSIPGWMILSRRDNFQAMQSRTLNLFHGYALVCAVMVAGIFSPASFAAAETNAVHIALVFDDGPFPEHAPKLLELFAREGIHVTFSLVASNVVAHPETARAITFDATRLNVT